MLRRKLGTIYHHPLILALLKTIFPQEGTRDNHLSTRVCGADGQPIAYLLGDNNREFTIKSTSYLLVLFFR